MRKAVIFTLVILSVLSPILALAAGPLVSANGNKHNLSSSNLSVTYHAVEDPANPKSTQICVFCHTPHNSVPHSALWNRKDPTTTFGRYSSSSLVIRNYAGANYGEPNGSSRLCLSCHDGVTALGDLFSGPSVDFGANAYISGIAKFDTTKVKLGHHPVSFKYDDSSLVTALNNKTGKYGGAGTYQLPAVPSISPLDKQNRMQCTTCHDPHQNKSDDAATYDGTRKVAPFWVYHSGTNTADQDHDAVCKNCHTFSDYNPPDVSQPWPWPL